MIQAAKRLGKTLKATIMETPVDVPKELGEIGISCVRLEDCAGCQEPCDDLGSFPPKFDNDTVSQLFGTAKPYRRQVILSTGTSNWASEVTEDAGTLAAILSEVDKKLAGKNSSPPPPETSETLKVGGSGPLADAAAKPEKKEESRPGLFNTTSYSRLSILNGSHRSVSEGDDHQTAIVLPDYKYVTEIGVNPRDSEKLWKMALDPALRSGKTEEEAGETGGESSPLQSWPLPYDVVILLCSHKKRDNRCGIAAPILEHALFNLLSAKNWEVHTDLEPSNMSDPSLESLITSSTFVTAEEREAKILERIKEESTHDHKKALLIKTSHVGGHKFSGNMIIYIPTGASVWYGRVSPKEISAVVDETIIGGKIIPELLRAGVNLKASKRGTLYDW